MRHHRAQTSLGATNRVTPHVLKKPEICFELCKNFVKDDVTSSVKLMKDRDDGHDQVECGARDRRDHCRFKSVWPIRNESVARTTATKTVRLATVNGSPVRVGVVARLQFVLDGKKRNMKFFGADVIRPLASVSPIVGVVREHERWPEKEGCWAFAQHMCFRGSRRETGDGKG